MPSSADFSTKRDYYAILGVSQDADGSDLKTAFFRLAKELHHDKTAGDPQKAERYRYDRARLFFASSSRRGGVFRPPPTSRQRQPPPRSPSPIRTRNTNYTTPAADCKFSEYFFRDYRGKRFLQMFRDAYEDAHRTWKQSDDEAKDARDRMYDYAGAPEPSLFRKDWERKRRSCEDLRLKKNRAEAIMRQHKERAKLLWKRRKAADAKVKRADAARKRSERQRRDRARRNA